MTLYSPWSASPVRLACYPYVMGLGLHAVDASSVAALLPQFLQAAIVRSVWSNKMPLAITPSHS